MKETKGSIISISATFHYTGTPLQIHAAAAKAGVDAIAKTLAVEWGPYGIRTNVITPGPIAGTVGMEKLSTPESRALLESAIPLRRQGTVEDIANAAIYLSSSAAKYITGAILVIDGGMWLNNQAMMPDSMWRGKL